MAIDNLSEHLITLAKIEERLVPIGSDHPRKASFRIVGNWLIREEILLNRLKSGLSRKPGSLIFGIPGFPIGSFFSALRHFLLGGEVSATLSACSVLIQRNIRAFYVGHRPLSLWIGLPPIQENLASTIEVRNQFVADRGMRIPIVFAQDTAAENPYILEELISGRRFGRPADWNNLADRLFPSLFQFYDKGVIRHRRAAEVYEGRRIVADIAALLTRLKWKNAWVSREKLLEVAEQCLKLNNETIPMCIGHGDLGKSNLLVTEDGGLALLDWERSRELPMADDLIKLVCRCHRLAYRLAPEVRKRTENPVAMPPNRQLTLATLKRIAQLSYYDPNSPLRSLFFNRSKKQRLWLNLGSFIIKELS